jgi:hypothetical protein
MQARYAMVHPSLVLTQHSWFYPERVRKDKDHGAFEANGNMLIPGGLHSKTGFGGAQVKSLLCRIRKVEGEPLNQGKSE